MRIEKGQNFHVELRYEMTFSLSDLILNGRHNVNEQWTQYFFRFEITIHLFIGN